MKKQLLSIFAAVAVSTVFAQVPATDWSTNQDAIFPSPSSVTFPGVKLMDAVDANVVWVTGWDLAQPNRAYNWYSRTVNGGSSFAGGNIYSDTNTYVLANMEGIDANTAWVSAYKKNGPGGGTGGGAIHRTTNGGTNWINMTPGAAFTSTTSFANWVTFLTPSVGIANGDPVNGEYEIWRTTDGGTSWTQISGANIPNPLTGEFAIVNLYAKVGTSNIWFGTNGNRIFRTTDAGLTYSVASVGAITNTVTEIAFSSPANGICYMVNASANLELWNTIDGGINWSQITPLPANLGFADITPIPGTGNICSYGSGGGNEIISYSGDNGVTWTDFGSVLMPYITGDWVNGSTAWAGSLEFPGPSSNFSEVWKYSGPAITGTALPAAAFSIPATICHGSSPSTIIPVNSSAGSPAMTYSWTVLPAGATLSSPTASAPLITFASANSYTVILVATNSVGSNTTTWVVDVAACTAPVASFTLPASACTNFSVSTGNTSTGAPAPGYFWTISPATGATFVPSPASANPGITFSTAGTYTVSLTTSNASGTAQTTQTISVAPCAPTGSIALTFSCNAVHGFSTTTSFVNPVGGPMTYTWSVASPSTGVGFVTSVFASNVKVNLGAGASGSYTLIVKVKNASGTATITQEITEPMYRCDLVGLSEKTGLSANLSVYPNPAHDQINITLPSSVETYKVKLTNILGSVVYEEKALNSSKDAVINLANKPKGVYFLTVESNNEKATRKIVVE